MTPLVTYVIPTRNRGELMERTVRSILRQELAPEQMEIFVVDNGSTDDTESRIDTIRSESNVRIAFVKMHTNGGPARSRNHGASQAQGDFIAFVDSDVEIESQWTIAMLQAFDASPAVGLITGKIVFASDPEIIHCFGGELSRIGLGWDAFQGRQESEFNEPRYALWAPSASVMVRRSAFEFAGAFDDAFFYGYEDSDLGWRLSIAGWKCLCLPSAVARHATTARIDDQVRKVSDEIVFHYSKNRLRSMLKSYSVPAALCYIPLYVGYALIDATVRAPRLSKWRALAWNVKALAETLRLRRAVQQSRKVSDRELWPAFSRSWFPEKPLEKRMRDLSHLHGGSVAVPERSRI